MAGLLLATARGLSLGELLARSGWTEAHAAFGDGPAGGERSLATGEAADDAPPADRGRERADPDRRGRDAATEAPVRPVNGAGPVARVALLRAAVAHAHELEARSARLLQDAARVLDRVDHPSARRAAGDPAASPRLAPDDDR